MMNILIKDRYAASGKCICKNKIYKHLILYIIFGNEARCKILEATSW